MDLVDRLVETGQIPDVPYKISWLGGFEINPRDKAAAELDRIRGLQIMTDWVTVNEIRLLENLERVLGGDVVLGLSKLEGVTAVPNLNSATSKRRARGL
jgi:hypothetical protein